MNNKDRGLATRNGYKVFVSMLEVVYSFEVFTTDESEARHKAYATMCVLHPDKDWDIVGIELIDGACNE